MRFVVPVRSIHAAPNPRYFGAARGITLFNYVADNFLGWANIVITGTKRDSQFLLDRILDDPTTLDPKEIMTDTASASDLVFGLCQLLGFRYPPAWPPAELAAVPALGGRRLRGPRPAQPPAH